MKKQTAASINFQRKMSDFCDIRVSPHVSRDALDNIKPYMSSLIVYRKKPPMHVGRIDWQTVSNACDIANEMSPELRKTLRPGLEAIGRWIDEQAARRAKVATPARPSIRDRAPARA